jgi:NitT/TauT family transport system ATP-binding protein
MNLDLAEIWARTRKTTILITHSVSEAVFLADRVVVLSSRPGTIREIVDIPIRRPRTVDIRTTREFQDLVQQIGSYIGFEFV